MQTLLTSSLPLVLAYIGPGSGLMGIAILLAMLAAVVVVLIGFLWYPLKGLRRRLGPVPASQEPDEDLFEE